MTPSSSLPTPTPSSAWQQSRRWLGWALVVLVGLVMVVAGSLDAARRQSSVVRTAMVVAQMQATVQALSADALAAAQGNPGAIDRLGQSRAQVDTLRGLLRTGGYAAPSDPAPVLILEGRDGFPLQALDQALAGFDQQQQKIQESAVRLRSAALAEERLAEVLPEIQGLVAQVRRTQALAAGTWGRSLHEPLGVLSRQEMRTMRVIFSPLPGAEALQQAWSEQFGETAARLAELAERAARDPDLPSASRSLVQALAQATTDLAQATATLAQTQADRLAAQGLQAPILEAVVAIQGPLAQLGTRVMALQASRPWSAYVAWVGVVLVLAGLVGLVRTTMVLDARQWAISQDSRQSHGVIASVERLTAHLRRILTQDGRIMEGGRLQEDPSAETFALASMVNALLDAQERLRVRAIGSADNAALAAGEAMAPVSRTQMMSRQLDDHAQRTSGVARSIAQALARQAQDPTATQARRMVELTTAAELVMQEGTFKMDAMRETVQATSKRLKRLAEGAQAIVAATVIIDEISRRVKVLSTNAAIEAAAHGEGGRKFAVLAKEIERLSQSAHLAASDIGEVVATIQADAQETVATMERSTTEVVASTELAQRASQALREIERMSTGLVDSIENSAKEVEKQAVAGFRLSQGCDQAATMAREVTTEAEGVARSLEKARAVLRDTRQAIADDSST